MLEKYLGETEKSALALFSLARKLAPSVIFIDEVDTLLGRRDSSDSNKHFAQMQGMFLQQWDGLSSNASEITAPVVVLGATNRPADIDKAFLRRMPYSIEIGLPDLAARIAILKKMLSKEIVDSTVNIEAIAGATLGYSGSDLREVVRVATMQRVKDLANSAKAAMKTSAHAAQGSAREQYTHAASLLSLRPLTQEDFNVSLRKRSHASTSVNNFQQQLASEEGSNV